MKELNILQLHYEKPKGGQVSQAAVLKGVMPGWSPGPLSGFSTLKPMYVGAAGAEAGACGRDAAF